MILLALLHVFAEGEEELRKGKRGDEWRGQKRKEGRLADDGHRRGGEEMQKGDTCYDILHMKVFGFLHPIHIYRDTGLYH